MAIRKKSKSAKIRALLDKGMRQKDISDRLKVSPQLVNTVARNYGKTNYDKVGNKEQKFIDKLLSLVNEYRKSK